MNQDCHTSRPVPTVRAVIADGEGRVLLLKRADGTTGQGGWCLPGGKIDYGQTVAEALALEVMEETTLRVTSAEFFMFQDSLPISPGGMHCINLYFVCGVEGEVRLNGESAAYAWGGREELPGVDVVFRNGEAIRAFFAGAAGQANT